jgi:DedD protein
MEKKKLLLVAVSVGVFLVIAVGAAILFFNQKAEAGRGEITIVTNQPARSATTDPSRILTSEELRGLQPPDAASPITVKEVNPADKVEENPDGSKVISIKRPETAAVPDATGPAVKPAPKHEAAAPAVTKTPVPAKPAASAAPAKKLYRDYWVQAGSYSTKERADGVKKSLDDKGITSIVTNQQVNGQTFFRVRVGPYTSKNEAEYWLAMIKSIDGFENSQVWESQSKR